MKEKILALLIAKFSGVRKDGLIQLAGSLALQVATDEEAQALVDKLDQSKVTEFIKEYRSGVDKEIATANKTTEEKLKEKFDFVEKGKGGADPTKTETTEGKDDENTPAWAKAIIKQNETLAQELASIKGEKITNARTTQFNEVIQNLPAKQKALFEKSFARMKFENDEEFSAYLEELKPEVETIVSEEDAKGATFGRPLGGGKTIGKEASEKDCDAIVEKIMN